MIEMIHWLGHDSFRIDGDVMIYIDPWKVPEGSPRADLILITHEHHDHFSRSDVETLRVNGTEIVAPAAVASQLVGRVHTIAPGDAIEVMGIAISVLPAYNLVKRFHPRSAGHVGYVVSVNGQRIYHAGDTDAIPEMAGLKPDVALLPVSGTYVMDPEEAVEAVRLLEPGLAIPMHYGDLVGAPSDAERFKELSPVPVVILTAER